MTFLMPTSRQEEESGASKTCAPSVVLNPLCCCADFLALVPMIRGCMVLAGSFWSDCCFKNAVPRQACQSSS